MPVNELQKEAAKRIFRDQINTVANIEQASVLYRAIVTLTPKGFRGSLLKKIDWPTSWAVLYGLSPAQISQNRESGAAAEVLRPVRLGGVERIKMWKALLKAYFAGNPEPMSQVDFPNWRAPGWMSDSEKREINEYIRGLYEAEAPLDSTMPVEEMSADDEVVAEMSANMGGEEETVVVEEATETPTRPNVRQPDLIESLYELYRPYWVRLHNLVDADDMRRALEVPRVQVRDAAQVILTLESLGYGYNPIKQFLNLMIVQGLQLVLIGNPTRRGYGAYFTVNVRGTENGRRYQSEKAYGIMSALSGVSRTKLKEQFAPSSSRQLQVMAFRGTRGAMGGYQVVSMKYIDGSESNLTYNEAVRKLSVARTNSQDMLLAAMVGSESPSSASTSRDSTQDAQAQRDRAEERAANASGEGYAMLGAMLFRTQMTFRSDGTFVRAGALTGRHSVIFYFVHRESRNNGRIGYPIYRAVWGEQNFGMTGIPNFTSGLSFSVDKIKDLWNLSGKLERDDVIKLQLVTDPVEAQNVRNAWSAEGGSFSVRRYDSRIVSVNFEDIKALSGRMNRLLTAEPEWAQAQQSVQLLTTNQLKSLATSPYSFAFGIEFEGFVRGIDRKTLSEKMREDGVKIYTTTGYKSTTPVEGEEPFKRGHVWRNESDSSVVGYDARMSGGRDWSGRGQTFEMVSNVLNMSSDYKSGNNDWIPELENYCESLAKNGVLVDPSSGIHIHVGYKNFNTEQTKNFFINSVLMIPVLKGLVSEAWKDRYYAKFPKNSSELKRKLKAIADVSGGTREVVETYRREFNYSPSHPARYSWLNTTNFGTSKPTYEFRFQGSSIEKDTMVNTVKILQQIWKASLEGVIPIKQGSGERQDAVLVDLLGNSLFSFARNRFAETELPTNASRSSNQFAGYNFPIDASSI